MAKPSNSSELSLDEEYLQETMYPAGKTYPLNSKRTVASQSNTASLLDLPGETSMVETHQLIEGRLMEMGHEPQNTQVVIKKDKQIFLVDDKGIIISTKLIRSDINLMSQEHVTQTQEHVSVDIQDHMDDDNASLLLSHYDDVEIDNLCSALCEACCQNKLLTA